MYTKIKLMIAKELIINKLNCEILDKFFNIININNIAMQKNFDFFQILN